MGNIRTVDGTCLKNHAFFSCKVQRNQTDNHGRVGIGNGNTRPRAARDTVTNNLTRKPCLCWQALDASWLRHAARLYAHALLSLRRTAPTGTLSITALPRVQNVRTSRFRVSQTTTTIIVTILIILITLITCVDACCSVCEG